jgi:hypothetical protein
MASLVADPISGLFLPRQFLDEKQSLKKMIDEIVDRAVLDNQHIKENYYLTLHMKFDKQDSGQFTVSQPIITFRLPPFVTNQLVFWCSNNRGICEILWMTSKKGKKLAVDFNTTGVAYLQAKGAMRS